MSIGTAVAIEQDSTRRELAKRAEETPVAGVAVHKIHGGRRVSVKVVIKVRFLRSGESNMPESVHVFTLPFRKTLASRRSVSSHVSGPTLSGNALDLPAANSRGMFVRVVRPKGEVPTATKNYVVVRGYGRSAVTLRLGPCIPLALGSRAFPRRSARHYFNAERFCGLRRERRFGV